CRDLRLLVLSLCAPYPYSPVKVRAVLIGRSTYKNSRCPYLGHERKICQKQAVFKNVMSQFHENRVIVLEDKDGV
ncbi:MAG TPA: hypothetical protein VHP83_20550, partial [Aggregatilineaceae bacterium]|nr:hypothetical protein [Aggregatilineaceae bacterium]